MVLSIYTMDDLTSNLYLTHESSGDKCIAAQLFSGGKKKANDSSKKIPCPAGEKTEEKKMDDDDPTKKSSIPDFLSKLYQMLNFEDAEIIQWDQGKIYVKDPDKLGKEVLKKYFRHSRYTSFQRQLNYFGFKKIEGKGKFSPCVYANDDFKGPDMRVILNIKRKTHAQHDYDLLMLAALDPKLWNETNGLSLEGSRKFLKKRNMSMGCMEPSSLRENKALRRTKSERCWEEQERQPTRGVGSRHCSNNNNNNHNSGEKPTKKINKKLTRRSSKTRRRPQNGKHRSSSSSNQQKSEESSKSSLSHDDDDSKSSLSFVQLTENLLGPDQGEDDGVVLRYSDIMAAAEVLLHEDDYDDNKDDVLVGVGKARNKNLSGLDLAHHHHHTLNQPECSSDHLHNQQGIMSSDNVPSIHMFEEQVCLSSPTAPSNTTVLNENEERTHGEVVSTCNHTQEHSRLSLDMDTIEQLASLMEGLPDWAAASTEEESCTSSSAAEIMTPIPQSSSNSSFVVLEEDDNVDDDINWDGVVLQSILR